MPDLNPDADPPPTLGHAFETFEAIRQFANRDEDLSPDLFAAFMSAAVAPADGRDTGLTADVLPARTPGAGGPCQPAAGTDPHEVADSIAASAATLATRLDHSAGMADNSQDRRACRDAAVAARQIHQLPASADAAHPR